MNVQEKSEITHNRFVAIDLFKILSMLMVVVLHVLGAGGINGSVSVKSANWYLFGGFETICIVAVNCFALTTGFIYVGKKIRIKNIFSLYLQVLFYSIVIASVCFIFKLSGFSVRELINYLFPILSGRYWYFSAYFVLFLIMPLLNLVLEKMDKNFLFVFLIGMVVFFGVFAFYGSIEFGDVFKISSGCSFEWLAICYLIGGAVRKYQLFNLFKARVWLLLYFLSTVLSFCVGLLLFELGKFKTSPFVGHYNFVFNILSSIFLLMFFARFDIKSNKFVSYLAKTTFGVYLFHEHILLKNLVIIGQFAFIAKFSPFVAIVAVLGCVLLIYIVGTIVETFRQIIFKALRLNKLSQKIDDLVVKKYNKLIDKTTKI